ncbi:bifunctional DNA primase/polymerase [Mycobacterium shimoidei]|nr:bifunctional DNA primase/polymerase [Mycobacterium shimoidei]
MRALTEAGLAVMLVYPWSKQPADMRAPQRKTADDRAAREAARAADRRGWERVKSPAGLALATTDAAVLDGYLDRYLKVFADRYPEGVAVNLAVEVGGSGLVVIDCDTAGQVAAFLADAEADPDTAPTVRSPGQLGPDGTMVHSDGGHYWFTVPEGVELPSCPGAMTVGAAAGDAYSVLWDRRYVLIPPSVRAEGDYTAAGEVHALPGWLADRITAHGQARAERSRDRAALPADGDLAGRIDAWAEGVTWTEILEPLGWVPATRPDSCGCEVWTAPGDHASPKSATAHDSGCGAGRYTETNAPLHIWTDHDRAPFDGWVAERGTATLSKLQAVAAAYHDNDEGAAMTAEGLTGGYARAVDDLPADFGKTDAEARAASESDPPSPPSPPPGDTATSDPTAQSVAEAKAQVAAAVNAADAMFESTAILRHIAACADARGSSRSAVLVQVLMRTALAVPPCVVIPASLGGDHVGLSVLAAVTGETSGGKGRAEAVGRDAVVLSSHGRVRRFAPMTPSTGEGLVSMFAETEKNAMTGRIVTRVHTPAVLLSFKDIDTFGALASRSGNSLVGALLSLYMGDHLGGFTREGARRVMLPAHTVVAGLSAGMQPEKGDVLLSPAMRDSGIPQRFLWTPVRNGRKTPRSTPPAPMTVEVPDLGVSSDPFDVETVFAPDEQIDPADLRRIEVAERVTAEIHAADEAKDLDVFGAVPDGQDQLLGHAMLTRVKVAFLLAVLHGETAVSAQWWELAGLVMAVSEATSNAVAVASGAAEIVAERQAGERIGHRFAASDQVRDDAKVRQVAERLAARVGDDWTAVNGKSVISASKHGLIPDAWRWLIDTGRVEAEEYEYQAGRITWRYRRVGR